MANNFGNPLDQVIEQQQQAATKLREGLSTPKAGVQSPATNATPGGDLMPPTELRALFEQNARETGVPVNILAALAQQESSYNPQAVGRPTKWGSAKGLMQYIDSTAKSLGIDPLDSQQSVRAAAQQFKQRLEQGYSVQDAIAAHHGGDDREQWGPKTAAYVQDVLGKAQAIGEGWSPAAAQPDLQAQLDAEEPGRYKVMGPEDVERYERRQGLMEGGPGLDQLGDAFSQRNPITPLTPENQQHVQDSVAGMSMLPIDQQRKRKAQWRDADREAGRAARRGAGRKPSMESWEPTLWEQFSSLIKPNKDAAAVELEARAIAKEQGISVDEVYQRAGGLRDLINPEGRAPIQATAEAAKILGPQIKDVLPAAANTVLRALRGGDESMSTNMLDKGIAATAAEHGEADPNYEGLAGVGESLGFSLVNMAASALAAAGGTAAAGPVGGIAAGMGASGTVAYRASRDQFIDRVRANHANLHGSAPTEKQWQQLLKDVDEAATQYGAFEAIPEAVSSMIFVRSLARPLSDASRAGKLGDALNRIALNQGSEQTSEMITGLGQNRAELEVGLTKEELSAAEVLRKQALNVALVSGISSGAGMAGRALYDQTKAGKMAKLGDMLNEDVDGRDFVRDPGYASAALDPANAGMQTAGQRQQQEDYLSEQQQAAQAHEQAQGQPTPAPTPNAAASGAQPGPLQRAAAKAVPTGEVVTINTPAGPVVGSLERLEEDGKGGWTAKVLDDEGQLHTFSDKDGVELVPGAPVAQGTGSESSPQVDQEIRSSDPVDPEQITPEAAADTQAQIDAIRDPSSAKDSALITPNSPVVDIPEGLAVIKTNQGLFVTSNPDKAAAVEQAGGQLSTEQIGQLLDYTSAKVDNDGTVVQALDAQGNVVHEEATNQQQLEQAAAQAEAMAPKGGQVEVKDAQQALDERAAKVELEQLDEPQLREQLKFLADQAKRSGGWSKPLVAERRKIEKAISALADKTPAKTPETVGAADTESTRPRAERTERMRELDEKHEREYQAHIDAMPEDLALLHLEGINQHEQDYQADPNNSVYKEERELAILRDSKQRYIARLKQLGYDDARLNEAINRLPSIPLPKPGDKFTFGRGKATVLEASPAGIKVRKRGREETLAVSQYHANLEGAGELPAAELERRERINQHYAKAQAEQTAVEGESPAAEPAQAEVADQTTLKGSVKWFGSQEKADNYIKKTKLSATHEVVQVDKRFEIHALDGSGPKRKSHRDDPHSPPSEAQLDAMENDAEQDNHPAFETADGKAKRPTKLSREDRARQIIGADVGDTIILSGEAAYASANKPYEITRIDKNGAVWIKSPNGSTNLSLGELQGARNRGVTFSKAAPKAEERRPQPGEEGYTLDMAKADLEALWQLPGATGYVRDANVTGRIRKMEALIKDMQAAPAAVKVGEGITALVLEPSRPAPAKRTDNGQADAAPSLSEQMAAMSNAELSSMLDGIIAEDAEVADTAKPVAKRKTKTAPKNGAPKPRKTVAQAELIDVTEPSEVERTAAEMAKSLSYNVSSAGMEALKGLAELFGGPGKMSSGLTFDEESYAKAKPHFQAALKDAQAAGKDLTEFFRMLLQRFGAGVKPYIIRFANDQRDEVGRDAGQTEDRAEQAAPAGAAGEGALAGVQAADVSAPEGERDAERAGSDRSGADAGGTSGADGAGLSGGSGVGNGSGEVRVPAGGKRGKRGSGGQRGVQAESGAAADHSEHVAARQDAQAAGDYQITDLTRLGEGGAKTKFKNNVAAIRLVNELQDSGRQATPEEQDALARYVGWGGLAQAFDASNADWSKEHAELRELLSEEEWRAAEESTRYAHYTSQEIIGGMYDALKHLGFTGGRIVEPGSGVGNFIGLMPTELRGASRFTAVERERIAGGIAKALYPNHNVQQEDFRRFSAVDGYFDLALGNPPFASTTLTDLSGRKHLSGLSVHNYFFAKSVDMLREGGVLAMVVSNSFMDAKGDKARRYIGERTELLGAIRLPNNAFAKNASTEVTTDIVFLRKRPESEWGSKAAKDDMKRWQDLVSVADPLGGETIPLNRYFAENPGMMLGRMERSGSMYRANSAALVARPNQDTAQLMQAAIAKLPAGAFQAREAINSQAMEDAAVVALSNDTDVDVGGHYLDGERLFVRLPDVAGEGRAVELTAGTRISARRELGDKGLERVKHMAELRNTLRQLLAAEKSDAGNIDALRAQLNEQYDAYVKDNGLLNQRSNVQLFGEDPDFPLLASLEHGFDPGIGAAAAKSQGVKAVAPSANKAPIFTARAIEKHKPITSAESPHDALMVSIAERGQIDAGYIGELLGRDGTEVLDELSRGDNPEVFTDPAAGGYVLRDAYLSGNVRKKLKQAKAANMLGNVRALEKVIPEDIAAHEISAKIGAPWVPTDVYEEFAQILMGEGTTAKVVYVPAISSYVALFKPGSEVDNRNTYGTDRMGADEILASLLNSKEIKVGHYVDNEKGGRSFVLEQGETEAANDKARDIKDKFADWLFSDADRAERMQRAYNDAVNNYVTRVFDGSGMRFPGKVPDSIIKLRRHQRNAVARVIQEGRVLLDHVVGAGKTYTVIASAMELKRTGLANKPMIAVPNHLVKQWAADFYRLYPGANILTATKKDFEKANRRKFLAKVATGNWDAVVIAHSSFGFIKPDATFEQEFNQARINEVMDAIEMLADEKDQSSKRTVKQLAAMKEALENKLDSLRDKPMDDLLDFGQLGVDMLFVDEAHLFKNLMFVTKMQSVRGLGQPKGSQRAYDMFIKTHQLYQQNGNGRGVAFATGTPVSNSLAEMYHMLRYLAPETLKDSSQFTFDAWAKTFADVEQVWMQSLSGDGYKASNRMSTFVNTPELLRVYDQVADTVTIEDIKSAYAEENKGAAFPIPPLKGGKRTPVSIERSKAQTSYMEQIAERAKEMEQRKGKPEKGADNMLSIMGDARKAAMDIRLVDYRVTERDPNGRIAIAAGNIIEHYRRFDAVKGTQLVFSDMGTPKKQAMAELKEYNELSEAAAPLQDTELVAMADLGDESAIAALEKAEEALRKIEEKGRDWKDAVEAAQRGFSIYDDLKQALMEQGVPESEIAFIHDYNTDDQKAALFTAVNDGKVRVLMGSTSKMGAGTNVQRRLVALHHIDVPWKPSDIEQREGRIIRQGNLFGTPSTADKPNPHYIEGFEVEVMAYVTQDTLDLFMWQTQEKKLSMIGQLREGNVGREVDNAFEELQMSAGEMQAAATSNPFLMEEIQLKDKIKKLERQRRSFDGQKNDLVARRRRAERDLRDLPEQIKRAEKRETAAKKTLEAVERFYDGISATINGEKVQGSEVIRGKLRALVEAAPEVAKGDKKAKELSVDFNGKTYTSVSGLTDATNRVVGSARRSTLTLPDGSQVPRALEAVPALKQLVEDAVAAGQDSVTLGTLGEFELVLTVLDGGQMSVDMQLDGDEVAHLREFKVGEDLLSDSGLGENLREAVIMANSVPQNLQGSASYYGEQLERAQRALSDLESRGDLGVWPGEVELKAAREKYKGVLKKLAERGAEVADTRGNELLNADGSGKRLAPLDVRLKVGKTAGAKLPRGQVRQVALDLFGAGSVQERFVFTRYEDLPAEVRATAEAKGGKPEGMQAAYFDGKVYLVDERFSSNDDVAKAIFHELYVHGGLRAQYDRGLGGKMRQIMDGLGGLDGVLQMAADQGIDLSAYVEAIIGNDEIPARLQPLIITEELLAHIGESTGSLKRYLQEFAGAVRSFLRKLGYKPLEQLSINELAHVLRGARHAALRSLKGKAPKGDGSVRLSRKSKAQQDADLAAALAMDEDAYIRLANPSGKRLDADDHMLLNLGDLSAPVDAVRVGQFSDKQGRQVQVLRDAAGGMYAKQGEHVLGMVTALDGETVVEVVEQAKGKGVGAGLMKHYIKENPLAQSGGFTEGGEATHRSAFRQLKEEQGAVRSVLPAGSELDAAIEALDAPAEQYRADRIGSIPDDLGRVAKYVLHPRQIASLHKGFTPVYDTANQQFEMRDATIAEFQKDHVDYDNLSQAGKRKVNAVLELGRLLSDSYSPEQLARGVTNPGERRVVKFTEGGSTYRATEKLQAKLSGVGEIINLTQEEAQAYLSLRRMFDKALDKFRDQSLIDFGYPKLVGQKDAVQQLMQEAADVPAHKKNREAIVQRITNVARFIQETEQAKRAGYVPLARYGDYVVTVKERQFPITIIKDPDGGWLTRDLPAVYDDFLKGVGAKWNALEGGWELDQTQRRALIKENEKAIFSTKVEFTLKDRALLKMGRPVTELPSVKKALQDAEARKEGNPERYVDAFYPFQKKTDGGLKLSDIDALAEVASLDTDTWDAVREQLADAIKGQSFRKHFFQSQNVPGYTEDFERAIADYMAGMAGYLSRRHFTKAWDNAMEGLQGRLFEYASKYRAYANEPQEELAMLRQMGFLYYIAGVPATAVVNLTQPFLMTVPALNQFAKLPAVLKEVGRAYKDALAMSTLGKGLDMFDPSKAPADLKKILQQAWDSGMFVPRQTYEIMGTASQRNVGQRKLSRYFNKGTQAIAILFSYAERLNRLVTFIASARLLRHADTKDRVRQVLAKNPLARHQLAKLTELNFADFMIDETQFRMGKANRPTIMRGVGAGIMQFKGFVMQSIEAWFRLASQNGKQGVKAVASSLLAVVILGGLWGFPGADDLRDLIEKAYKSWTGRDMDMKSALREGIYEATGQRWLAEVATKGATFPAGVDSSRIGMGGIAPDTPLQMLGIPADLLIGRPVRAGGKLIQGEFAGAASELMPNFAKNVVQAIDWKTGGIRNGYGDKIIDSRDITGGMAALKGAGFQPSKVVNVRDYEYAQRRRETAQDQLKRRYIASLAKLHAERIRNPERASALRERIAELMAEVADHNKQAEGLEERIIIGKTALQNRIRKELGGVKVTHGKERKQARAISAYLREVYGLEE